MHRFQHMGWPAQSCCYQLWHNSKLGIYGKVLAENDLQGGHGIWNLQEIENMKNGKNATRIGIGILTSPVACLKVHIQTEAF